MFRKNVMAIIGMALICLITGIAFPWDITKDKCGFEVAVAHLDTQWSWDRRATYNSFLPATLHDNFALFRKYPNYIFPFNGAFRYWMVERSSEKLYGDYEEGDWDTLKAYIAKGRWNLAGGMIDEIDVNLPCAESLCRCFLYGNGYYEDRFGKRSVDIYLPDCFGFTYALPTIARHFGLCGFSTQKYEASGWYNLGASRSIMRWFGVDGSFLYAAMYPSFYGSGIEVNTNDGNAVFNASGMWITYDYYGKGDTGGAPPDNVVSQLCNLPNGELNGAHCFPAASDSLFRMLLALENAGNPCVDNLASFDDELVHTTHGVGCYTSHGDVKVKFRDMELAGLQAEPAAVIANKIASETYPQQRIWRAWFKGIDHAFHDDLTGTSDSAAYWCKWDGAMYDLDSQSNEFNDIRTSSNEAVAGVLNTQVSSSGAVPIVVYNPLGLNREDVVQAEVSFANSSQYVKVLGPDGEETPSQVIDGGGSNNLTILFLADVPSIGYSVYQVSPAAQACQIQTGLSVSANGSEMSSNDITVSIDATGDISQIVDKTNGNRNLFESSSRWEFRPDLITSFPPWEIRREDVMRAPSGVVDGNPARTVVEEGPVRVSVKVTRNKSGSDFTHYYRLGAGQAGRLVVADNTVDWKIRAILLKASFYFACSNANATFSLGVGTIDRPNATNSRYEVPAQQWGTISNGTFGVAVMNHYKYGWSKLSDNNLLLTLIHSTNPDNSGMTSGELFTHTFSYGIYGYNGDWTSGGVEQQCQRFQLPLTALQTTAHDGTGPFDNTFSLVRPGDSTTIMIMCAKKAEKSDDYVVRVREIAASSATAKLIFGYNVLSAKLTNGMEDDDGSTPITPAGANNNEVGFPITKYQIKTVKVSLGQDYVGGPTGTNDPIPGRIQSSDENAFKVVTRTGNGKCIISKFTVAPWERILKIFVTDFKGRTVQNLYNGVPLNRQTPIEWHTTGTGISSGIYFVNIITDRACKHAIVRLVR